MKEFPQQKPVRPEILFISYLDLVAFTVISYNEKKGRANMHDE